MAAIVNVSEITIKCDLALLQKKDILTREGGGKEGRWVIKQAAD